VRNAVSTKPNYTNYARLLKRIRFCFSPSPHKIPVKNTAEKPVFWTVLSVEKVIRSLLPSEVIGCGSVDPQNVPCTLPEPSPPSALSSKPLRSSTESYSQSCCNNDITHNTIGDDKQRFNVGAKLRRLADGRKQKINKK